MRRFPSALFARKNPYCKWVTDWNFIIIMFIIVNVIVLIIILIIVIVDFPLVVFYFHVLLLFMLMISSPSFTLASSFPLQPFLFSHYEMHISFEATRSKRKVSLEAPGEIDRGSPAYPSWDFVLRDLLCRVMHAGGLKLGCIRLTPPLRYGYG